jgi:hypothetical protein
MRIGPLAFAATASAAMAVSVPARAEAQGPPVTSLTWTPPSPSPLERPGLTWRRAPGVRGTQPSAPRRDSVRNGVLWGAAIGGAYGTFVAVKIGDELSTSGKVGVLWTSAAVGAGIGWLVDRAK